MKIIKKFKEKNKIFFFSYSKNSFFEGLYRFCAASISPLFLNFNPNFISSLSLLSGLFGLILSFFFSITLKVVLIFFLLSFVLDFTDGLVARILNKTSFFGRFIDGLYDIFVFGFLHLVLLFYLLGNSNQEISNLIYFFYLIIIFLLPIQHLILDRFSSLARWCNEINKDNKIKPYYRNEYFNKLTMLFVDLQHLSIFLILFITEIYISYVINFFFLISFLASICSISIYFRLSKEKFIFTTNQKDNDQ